MDEAPKRRVERDRESDGLRPERTEGFLEIDGE